MELLKEDGSLDIERINSLPLEERMGVIGELTEEHYNAYISSLPLNESSEPVHIIKSNRPMGDDGVDLGELINNLKSKCGR